mgnify:CR=1 FL=1
MQLRRLRNISNLRKDNILNYNNKITGNARLIAVSKTKPIEDLQEAYEAGQRLFGENKALEMRDKHEILPKDIRWHFIGHLQTNKVKKYNFKYFSCFFQINP